MRRRGGIYAIRNLFDVVPQITELVCSTKMHSITVSGIGKGAFAVRGTLFDKTPDDNWLVPWHQDLTICVKERLEVPGFGPWSLEAGVHHVQPPVDFLERMLAIPIHLDDCGEP
ncbi:MAG TPA: hypothetical protein VEX68_10410, partial [Bryobacteraceae bacterium]|nr:hypothetical protein [Bryobacteraceae bacterium]